MFLFTLSSCQFLTFSIKIQAYIFKKLCESLQTYSDKIKVNCIVIENKQIIRKSKISKDSLTKLSMYGIVSVVFILIAAFVYYNAATYNSNPFEINEIHMDKFIQAQTYEVFATCIDKTTLVKNPLQQVKIRSTSSNTFAVILNHTLWLKCSETSQMFDIIHDQQEGFSLNLQDTPQIKQIIGDYSIKHLQKDGFYKIKNHELFVLVLSIVQIKKPKLTDLINSRTMTLGVQNQNYLEPVLKPFLFFGIFNLIGISLIAFYRKNVFHTRVQLLATVALLVYLMWIGYQGTISFEKAELYIKLAMTCFVLIICIKNQLKTWQTSLIVGISFLNQILLIQCDLNDNRWSILAWIVYGLNFINASFITQGQNIEVVYFSIFGFATQYGLVNQSVDIMDPLIMSIILVTLLFGPTIFQLLKLKQNFDIQNRKAKERLHSYEISQNDRLVQK